jgi:hypothetical protein
VEAEASVAVDSVEECGEEVSAAEDFAEAVLVLVAFTLPALEAAAFDPVAWGLVLHVPSAVRALRAL